MKDEAMIRKLEKDTLVTFNEWKEIVILTSYISDTSVENRLKKKFDLEEKYIRFICRKFLKDYPNN
jgi:hypothetical protein